MNLEYLVHPWMKDFQFLLEKIKELEAKVQYLEMQVPNQKPQYQGYASSGTSAGGIVNPGVAGGTGGIYAGGAGGSGASGTVTQTWNGNRKK